MAEKKTNVISIRVSEDLHCRFKAKQEVLGLKPDDLIQYILTLINRDQINSNASTSELIQQHLQALQELNLMQQQELEHQQECNANQVAMIREQGTEIKEQNAKLSNLDKEVVLLRKENKELKDDNDIYKASVRDLEDTKKKLKTLEDLFMKIKLNQDSDPYNGKDMFSDLDNKTTTKTPKKKTVKK